MSVGIFFVFLLVMLFSFAIAVAARKASLADDPPTFLFGGNSSPLAMSSNIGSLLSLSVVFSLFAVGMTGYGFATFFSTLVGILAAYLTFFLSRRKLRRNSDARGPDLLLTSHLEEKDQAPLNKLIICEYILALVCEFAVFQSFLVGMETDFPSFALIAGLMVGCLCAGYVAVGGYSGVLKTDIFQVLIFVGACCLFIPVIFSAESPIVVAMKDSRAWQWPPLVGPITWATFTFAAFLSFPDVWIRNFGTLSTERFSSRWFFPLSFILLLVALVPILALTCYGAEMEAAFDRSYNVQRSLDRFQNLFFTASIPPLSKWLIAAAFLCVFITTIDTWLIGLLQYVKDNRRFQDAKSSMALLFGASIGAVGVSSLMSGKVVYISGLFLFPFLYFNAFLFFGKLRESWRIPGAGRRYQFGWASGMLATAISIALNWHQSEALAPHIILVGLVAQCIAFAIYPLVVRKLAT